MIALLLDLDGTLVDSVPDLHRAANQLLAEQSREAIDAEQARLAMGHGARALIRQLWAQTGEPLNEAEVDPLYRRFLAIYRPMATRSTRLYPQVARVLASLAPRHPLVLCTNKPEAPARDILDALGLSPLFAGVLGGDSLPTKKPDPAMLHRALELAGTDRGVLVGDSEVDVDAARAAGIPVIGVSWGYARGQLRADAMIEEFAHLPAALHSVIGAGLHGDIADPPGFG